MLPQTGPVPDSLGLNPQLVQVRSLFVGLVSHLNFVLVNLEPDQTRSARPCRDVHVFGLDPRDGCRPYERRR